MDVNALLGPWVLLAVVLVALAYAEKWIHSHLYGVGWLLTNDKRSATALYYVILLPGVFLHEITQSLIAYALGAETKEVMAWPEAQDDGTLRLDFVQVKNPQKAGWLRMAIIGAAPLILGITIIWLISNHVLNLEAFFSALEENDVTVIGPAFRELASTPDFFLWLYLMFAIGNAMLPTPTDRQGWPLLLGIFAAGLGFLVVIGVGDVLLETFTGPVAHGVNLLTTAFATVLGVEIVAILVVGFFEEILERVTKRKFIYSQSSTAAAPKEREPGSNLPLPPGVPLPSIYNLNLPIPSPALHRTLAELAPAARRTAVAAGGAPALARAQSETPSPVAARPGGPPVSRRVLDAGSDEEPARAGAGEGGVPASVRDPLRSPVSPRRVPPAVTAAERRADIGSEDSTEEPAAPGAGLRRPVGAPGSRDDSPFRSPTPSSRSRFGRDETEEPAAPGAGLRRPVGAPSPREDSPFRSPTPSSRSRFGRDETEEPAAPGPATRRPFGAPGSREDSPFRSPVSSSRGETGDKDEKEADSPRRSRLPGLLKRTSSGARREEPAPSKDRKSQPASKSDRSDTAEESPSRSRLPGLGRRSSSQSAKSSSPDSGRRPLVDRPLPRRDDVFERPAPASSRSESRFGARPDRPAGRRMDDETTEDIASYDQKLDNYMDDWLSSFKRPLSDSGSRPSTTGRSRPGQAASPFRSRLGDDDEDFDEYEMDDLEDDDDYDEEEYVDFDDL